MCTQCQTFEKFLWDSNVQIRVQNESDPDFNIFEIHPCWFHNNNKQLNKAEQLKWIDWDQSYITLIWIEKGILYELVLSPYSIFFFNLKASNENLFRFTRKRNGHESLFLQAQTTSYCYSNILKWPKIINRKKKRKKERKKEGKKEKKERKKERSKEGK